jgi:hypothetical protein
MIPPYPASIRLFRLKHPDFEVYSKISAMIVSIVAMCGFLQCTPTSFSIVANHSYSHNRGFYFMLCNHHHCLKLPITAIPTIRFEVLNNIPYWHFKEHMLFCRNFTALMLRFCKSLVWTSFRTLRFSPTTDFTYATHR